MVLTRRPAVLHSVLAVTILIACLWPEGVVASGPAKGLDDFSVRTWNENDGLFASRISAIEQDADGYLWLGTDVGLVRFDGVRFVPITQIGNVSLPTANVPTLLSAQDGSLWIATVGQIGLVRWRNGVATTYGQAQGLDESYAMALLEDRSGVMWAGTRAGVFRFDGARWRAVEDTPGLTGTAVMALFESSDRKLWAADQGTHKILGYDLDGHFLYSWGSWGEYPGGMWGVHGMSTDQEGNFYVAEVNNGRVQKYRPRPGANPAFLVGKPWKGVW